MRSLRAKKTEEAVSQFQKRQTGEKQRINEGKKNLENQMISFGLRSPVSPILNPDLRGNTEESAEAKRGYPIPPG